jgi:L-ribulose-5-phosphate 4-epimerase
MNDELAALKAEVCALNRALFERGLVTLTWGNVSGVTRDRRAMVIKPSGAPYETMTPDAMSVLAVDDGRILGGALKPSTDAPTHLVLYRAFAGARGVVHAHSPYATMFAEARREIPCFGTTHADHFAGPIPLVRPLSIPEVEGDYEAAAGRAIVERFGKLDPVAMPAALLAGHAAFAWGPSPTAAFENAVALEAVARIAHGVLALNPAAEPLEGYVLRRHHERKHGPQAYYGQR